MKTIFYNLWDRMNPIVVKELRQSIQGKHFRYTIMGFMLIQLIIFCSMLASTDVSSYRFVHGMKFFMAVIMQMLLLVAVILPLFAGNRFLSDTEGENLDLIYSSTITPGKVIWGKFLSSQIYSLLIAGLCLPFLASSYFLRGVDLRIVGIITIAFFSLGMPATTVFILSGVAPGSQAMKRGRNVVICIGAVACFIGVINELPMFFRQIGRGGSFNEFYGLAAIFVLLFTVATALGLTLATAFIAPESSNRSKAFRITAGITMWLTLIPFLWLGVLNRGKDTMQLWLGLELTVTFITTFFLLNENSDYNQRIRSELPRSFVGRFLKFPFTAGGVNAIYFFFIRVISVFSVYLIYSFWRVKKFKLTRYSYGRIIDPFCTRMFLLTMFIFSYLVIGSFLYHKIFIKKNKKISPLTCAMMVYILTSGVAVIVGMIFKIDLFWLGPMGAFYGKHRSATTLVASIWVLASAYPVLTLFLSSWNKFKR